MRVAVIGTSGSGKTTLGRRLADELGLRHIELDAINWQPGWRGLNEHDPDELLRRVEEATAADAWIIEGGYSQVRPLVWSRATHLVWLDYSRPLIMQRVIRRSIARALDRKPLWNGNRERWWWWLKADHPIRWAWDTWARRRTQFAELLEKPEFAHLDVRRLGHPREVAAMIETLRTSVRDG
jgi:adenylate kinase family enzyme